jgi:hypothetical protein
VQTGVRGCNLFSTGLFDLLLCLVNTIYREAFIAPTAIELCPDKFHIANHISIATGRGKIKVLGFFGLGINDLGNLDFLQFITTEWAKMLSPFHK